MLKEDLQPLGKALARRGSYKQIAKATLKSSSLKQEIIGKVLDALSKECNTICSRNEKTLLRKVSPDDMQKFSLQKLCEEWKKVAPLFHLFFFNNCDWQKEGE